MYYRQVHLYDMKWEQDLALEYFFIAAAKFGGPIARIMKPKSLILGIPKNNQMFREYLTINDSAGKLKGKVLWNFNKKFVGMGWTNDEILTIVYADGEIQLLDIYGDPISYPPPPPLFGAPNPKEKEIVACEIFENMLIFLTADNTFYYVRNFTSCKPEVINYLDKRRGRSTCFKAIPANHSYSSNLDILCGDPNGGLILIQESKDVKYFSKIPFTNEEISRVENIALSVTGEFLALLLEGSVVVVLEANFSRILTRIDVKIPLSDIKQLVWCGTDAVCVVCNEFIGVLGPDNTTASMDIDKKKEGVFCVPEIDGMRVITTEKCEYWEKVDEALQMTLSIGSFSPPALLLTANEGYLENSGSSGESIRSLQQSEQLLESVEKLLQAASAEFDVDSQEKLLKAAAFGKTFLAPGTFDSNKLVEIVKNLKVLNNIRREWVARPLTYKQLLYSRNNGELLIKRLLESRYHYLAIQISKLWKLRVDEIYVNWACVKLIDQKYTDSQMCDLICEKLNSCKSVKYTDIARKALDYGRRELAIKLLEHEPAISRKVPLLLYMKEYERALDKAIESSDPDDIYLVIMRIHEEDTLASEKPDYVPADNNSVQKVLQRPIAREMFLSYARQVDEKLLRSAFKELKRFQDAGNFAIEKAYKSNLLKNRVEFLTTAKELYSKYDRDPLYEAATKEHITLITQQKRLIKETQDRGIVDCSICDTIIRLLKHGQDQNAEKIAKQFSISEKKMWYLRLRVKVSVSDWAGIEVMTKQKKAPPIGYRPFANVLIQKSQYELAEQVILKVPEVDYQITMLQYIESYMKAAEVAVRAKMTEVLPEILQKTTDPAVREYIEGVLAGGR